MPEQDASTRERIEFLVSRGVTLPALPAIGVELMELIRQPIEDIEIKRVRALIENDPVLAARVLHLANSPFYGARRGIKDIGQAITLIGLGDTIGDLNYYLMRTMLPQAPKLEIFSAEHFWLTSWRCATAARMLAEPQYGGSTPPGDLYMTGLLHGIGQLVLAIYQPDLYTECFFLAQQNRMPLPDAEREVLGVDHAALGAHLLDTWNLPEPILSGVGHHHEPRAAQPPYQELCGLLQLAIVIVEQIEREDSGDDSADMPRALAQCWVVHEGRTQLAEPDSLVAAVGRIRELLDRRQDLLPGN